MESMSKPELISTINKQTDQLKRYETRLRDVVTAYKGLVKQKEALEVSLQAINKSKTVGANDDSLAALSLSLTTLTAEKTRMEEAFQADKKIAKENYESSLQEMRNRIHSISQQHQSEVENLRAKLTFEMQEREKEYANHAAILKELQLKINSERKSKEKLEDRFVISAESSVLSHEMEKRVRDLNSELQATQRKLNRAEARTVETPQMLVRLQEKIALLQQGHSVALREEQIKAKRAEETARKVCASQEERVAMLEAKLAELSHTVGEYDLQRRKDQQVIQQLRENINNQILDKATVEDKSQSRSTPSTSETDTEKLADTEYLQNLIDKIHLLKQELLVENDRIGSPIDVSSIFSTNENIQDAHTSCRAELQALRTEYDMYKRQLVQNNVANNNQSNTSSRDIEKLKSHVKVLQDKIEFMNTHLDEKQREFEELIAHEEEKRKHEVSCRQDIISELKSRILNLEKQLQNQRERYSVLLEETESYIRVRNDRARKYSGEENQHLVNSHKEIHGSLQEASSPPHMLHYAQELARKDLDISHLRKDKHILEGQLRDCQRDATIEKVRYKEVVKNLKEEIDRLQRIQSREGANLEYLKNVVLSYLLSSDYAGRKHMLNAISAVLHFTEPERKSVYKLL